MNRGIWIDLKNLGGVNMSQEKGYAKKDVYKTDKNLNWFDTGKTFKDVKIYSPTKTRLELGPLNNGE